MVDSWPLAETRRPGRARSRATSAGRWLWFHRQEPLALQSLARQFAGPADRLGLLARLSFGWFLVMAAQLHLAENALALHLFLQRLEGLVDIVVTDKNLHACSFAFGSGIASCRMAKALRQLGASC